MAVHVRPVKKKKAEPPAEAENAVHFYRRDVDAKPSPAGSFLGAFVHHSGVPAFYAQSYETADYDDFVSRVARADTEFARPCHYVQPGDIRGFDTAPVLRLKQGAPAPLIWRRRSMGQRRYSIAAEFSQLGSAEVHSDLGDVLMAPTQPWDALVFPSKTMKYAAEGILNRQADYLYGRLGVRPEMPAHLVVIPPGVNVQSYQPDEETERSRMGVRRRLGIADEDFCVLMAGDFSFFSRAHPTPLYLALESAARRSSVRIHLLQAGWFENDRIERAYRDAVREFAPAVNAVFLDSREGDVRERVWAAADAFAAFHDTMMLGVDSDLLEAMAAGLPIVATDWSSNRDLVKHGETGYLIPSWLPLAESGGDLTLAPENRIGGTHAGRADTFLSGTLGQMTAIDVRAAAEAFQALASDADKRSAFGAAARARAQANFDWAVVVRRHQALWGELRRVRGEAAEIAPPVPGQPAVPHLDDPFRTFQPFASHVIGEDAVVSLTRGLAAGEGISHRLERLRANAMNDVAAPFLLDTDEQLHVLSRLADVESMTVLQIAALVAEDRRYKLPRTLGWLAKMGIVHFAPGPTLAAATAADAGVPPVELGLAARRNGAEREALAYFQTAVRRDPNDAAAHQHLGEMLADANRIDEAVAHFERALAANPNGLDARMDLGKAMILKGQHAAGIAHLQEAADLAPENPDAHYLLGVAYRRQGAAADAVRALERSVRLDAKRPEALVHLGYARKSAGRRAEAVQAFKDVLKLSPANLFARAGAMTLDAEHDGRKALERDAATRRVALYFSGPHQFVAAHELFNALKSQHWPLLTGDGQELAEFRPDVVVSVGIQTAKLRDLVPNALVVAAPAFLASQNRFADAFDGADHVCAPSELIADTWQRLGLVRPDRVRAVGYLPLDPLFRGDAPPSPTSLQGAGPTVLYAPGLRPGLSSVPLLGDDPVPLIRGARDDVTVVIKPHPDAFERRQRWIEHWRRTAARDENVVFVDDPSAEMLPYLRAADVLISDASSIVFEFAGVDRPILLLKNPAAADDAGFDPQGIEWRWRDIGREIINPDDLARAVDLALKTPDAGAEIRARYRAALFGNTADGESAHRIAELITELST